MYRSSMIVVALLAAFAATAQTAIPSSQRDALTAIYKSTNGPSWNDDTNWLGSPGSECTWAGVRCDDEGTTVTGLYLEENNLTGSLPPEIGNLPDLEELELYINAIGGTIPSSIGNLPKLRGLLLFDNQLSGSLPVTIGNLSALENLYLDRNNLTGQLPDTMGGLTSLVNFSCATSTFPTTGSEARSRRPSE
jgi:Leucine-rich repeat (LRR) protein